MITFITCSLSADESNLLRANIQSTIGDVPFEFVAFDNRERAWGLCQVYNHCAERAQYDYLCFLHEDVQFDTPHWGAKILAKLSEPTCGVIGFAGSDVRVKQSIGWYVDKASSHTHYLQHFKYRQKGPRRKCRNVSRAPYHPVVVLDGMALFVRRDVWGEVRFDDQTYSSFHCYDIDFTLAVAQRYDNYVCAEIMLEHFSDGQFDSVWREEMKKYNAKWAENSPYFTVGMRAMAPPDRAYTAAFLQLKYSLKLQFGADFAAVLQFMKQYARCPSAWLMPLHYLHYSYFYSKRKRALYQEFL